MWPPADSMRALSHTVRDSERIPCAPISLSCDLAAATTWSQVTGWVMSRPAAWATDLRYQSSWVLAQNGTATSLPFQVEPSMADCTTPCDTRWATSSGTGARKPACANSGMYGGSRLMMSIVSSLAASLRTSCSRWEGESRGSWETSIVYRPPAWSLHRLAISCWPPESGLMYQVSVGGPPDPPPHAARLDASTSAATAPMGPRRRAARPGEEPPTVRRTCMSGPHAWDTGIPSGAAPPGE